MVPIYRYLDAHQDFDEKDVRDFLRKEKPFSVLDYGKDAWRLQDVMVADELYASYPILKNALIHFEKLERGLFGMARGGAITLNSRNDDNEQKRTIVHEVQHVIQELEGVATGGSEDFARSVLEDAISYAEARRGDAQAALESYEKIRGPQGLHRPDYAKRVKEADDRVKELEALRNANLSDFDLYERLVLASNRFPYQQRMPVRQLPQFNISQLSALGLLFRIVQTDGEWAAVAFHHRVSVAVGIFPPVNHMVLGVGAACKSCAARCTHAASAFSSQYCPNSFCSKSTMVGCGPTHGSTRCHVDVPESPKKIRP